MQLHAQAARSSAVSSIMRSTSSWMRNVSRSTLAMKRWRSASGMPGSRSNSAAPRMADSGLFSSWVKVCT
jgi:hypothetical protein